LNATSIGFGLFIVIFTILLLPWMRKLMPQTAGGFDHKECAQLAD
jgi:hypothetical protein